MASAGARGPTIVCAGIAVLDHLFRVERFPVAPEKAPALAAMTVVGGCAANAAIAIVRLGGAARLAAPLGGPAGQDVAGDRILAAVAAEGVACADVVRVAGLASPVSAIIVDAAGERTIVNHRDDRLAGLRCADPARLVAGADAVLADNRFPDFVLPICAAARARGLPVILDGDRPMRETDALLAHASHVVFSAEGIGAAAGGQAGASLLRFRKRTAAFLAVTDGANDIFWLEGERLRRTATFPVDAVDTLAAGDVFHGAFALAIAEGQGEAAALRFAAAVAAIKCTRFGGGAGAPARPDVEALLAR